MPANTFPILPEFPVIHDPQIRSSVKYPYVFSFEGVGGHKYTIHSLGAKPVVTPCERGCNVCKSRS